ncbi:putative methyltransferase DDB_G0268948 isoform X2 [Lycorma delicatula]|uniref:putative methyltransferase DDB_G0268948 isoform X2 n=1 Tax=Lycorma delicatula TaxID=130591 RepID=UPI003F510C77
METYLTSQCQAELYNKFRPSPPQELSDTILDTAVDVGCGSGQSTSVLAPYFKNVIGIDNCSPQINEANKKLNVKNVTYRLGSYDNLDFADNSVQLVTAGQSAHFFDMHKFYSEVGRILQNNGVLAIYGYCLPVPFYEDISLEHIFRNVFENKINTYLSDGSKMVYYKNYKTKEFEKYSFSTHPVIREEFIKTISDASLQDLIGYMKSWSGFQRLKSCCGENAADQVIADFQNEIMSTIEENRKPEHVKLAISFKYFLLLGRND